MSGDGQIFITLRMKRIAGSTGKVKNHGKQNARKKPKAG
jgi:hypothetical protein